MAAQEAIAFKSLFNRAPKGADPQTQFIQAIESVAQTPDDKLHMAILVGYLQGNSAGLSRLKGLPETADPDTDIAAVRTIFLDGSAALKPAQADGLIRRHGYFGRLALAVDAPPESAGRKSIESAAARTLLLLGVFGLGVAALGALSLALFVVGIVFWGKGKIRHSYVPRTDENAAYLEAFALYLVLFVVLGFTLRGLRLASPNWNFVALLILPVAVLWITRRSGAAENWRVALGWYSGRGWFRECGAGVVGYLACWPVIFVGFVITLVLVRVTGTIPRDAITPLLQGRILPLYALACIYAPVLEETMFRGALFHHVRGRWGWAASACVVAFLFSVIHPQGWVAVPVLGTIAIVLAGLREWRGSIIASMTAHAFNNFLVVTLALAFFRRIG